jgi:hypothetical protein
MFERLQAEQIPPSASAEEAGAIMAALERFERDTATRPASAEAPTDDWARAAILEGLRQRDDDPSQAGLRDPWINT